jgi:hypothetical protein
MPAALGTFVADDEDLAVLELALHDGVERAASSVSKQRADR